MIGMIHCNLSIKKNVGNIETQLQINMEASDKGYKILTYVQQQDDHYKQFDDLTLCPNRPSPPNNNRVSYYELYLGDDVISPEVYTVPRAASNLPSYLYKKPAK